MFLRALVLIAAASAPDAGAPGSALTAELQSLDGGALQLDGGVPGDADLALELHARLTDFRVRLVDASGRQLGATEDVRIADDTRVAIHPDAPLAPGTRYAVVVEPETSDSIRDAAGQAHAPLELHFTTAGEPPAKRPKPSRHRRRHR